MVSEDYKKMRETARKSKQRINRKSEDSGGVGRVKHRDMYHGESITENFNEGIILADEQRKGGSYGVAVKTLRQAYEHLGQWATGSGSLGAKYKKAITVAVRRLDRVKGEIRSIAFDSKEAEYIERFKNLERKARHLSNEIQEEIDSPRLSELEQGAQHTTASIITIGVIGLLAAAFFLAPTITGNAILGMEEGVAGTVGWIGLIVVVFVAGLWIGLSRRKKKAEDVHREIVKEDLKSSLRQIKKKIVPNRSVVSKVVKK